MYHHTIYPSIQELDCILSHNVSFILRSHSTLFQSIKQRMLAQEAHFSYSHSVSSSYD